MRPWTERVPVVRVRIPATNCRTEYSYPTHFPEDAERLPRFDRKRQIPQCPESHGDTASAEK